MSKTNISIIVSLILVAVGLISFSVVMTVNGWNFDLLNTVNYETNVYELTEDFSSVNINTVTTDIEFISSNDDKVKVVIFEEENVNHLVKVENGELKIDYSSDKRWYENIQIDFKSKKISVYLPKNTYNELKINSSTSDVYIKDLNFNKVNVILTTGDIKISNVNVLEDAYLKVTTGDIEVKDLNCKNFTSLGTTGDIELETLIASQKIVIERDTGDVDFSGVDASDIKIITTTGDVEGSVLSEMNFIASATTGDVNVPETTTGGRCEVKTTTGDINIRVK